MSFAIILSLPNILFLVRIMWNCNQLPVQRLLYLPLAFLIVLAVSSCNQVNTTSTTAVLPVSIEIPGNPDQYLEVDCMLPGQVRKLGTMLYTSPRRPVKTTAGDCEIRGGEYVVFDRANYRDALAVWLVDAEAGDPVAQTYTGEIYLKSPPDKPRYDLAAKWFERAATQGHKRALVNLAYLYEHGLGVPASPDKAAMYYAKASGSDAEAIVQQYQMTVEERAELKALKEQNLSQRAELLSARKEIETVKTVLISAQNSYAQKSKEVAKQAKTIKEQQELISGVEQKLAKNDGENAAQLQQQLAQLNRTLHEKEQALHKEKLLAAQLQQEVEIRKKQADSYQLSLAATQEQMKNLPGPKIEILDPQLLRTRGIVVAPIEETGQKREVTGRVWSATGIAEILVNGDRVTADDDGRFKSLLMLDKDERKVKVIARDINGKEDLLEFSLQKRSSSAASSIPTGVAAGEAPIVFGKYFALIIGNNHYQQLPTLKTPIEDAKTLADILQHNYGFEVTLLLDADRNTILSTMNKFRKELTEKDNFLIYYAGHGTLVEQNTEGFWLPIDSSLDDDVNWIPTDRITGIMNLMAAKQIMVIADACYSGIMTRASLTRLEAGKTEEAKEKWLRKMAAYKSRVIISSGETKPVLDGGGGKHSVFAKSLIDQLEKNHSILLGIDLHRAIVATVVEASGRIGMDQVPQYAGLNRAGHELGDFLFVPVSNKG